MAQPCGIVSLRIKTRLPRLVCYFATKHRLSIHMNENDTPIYGSFVDNMSLSVHRWFRYSAGFSGQWARDVIAQRSKTSDVRILDPFVGCGTTLIAAEQCEVDSWGLDSHPFVGRVAQAKLAYRSSPQEFLDLATVVLEKARGRNPSIDNYASLIRRCYTDEALGELDCLKSALMEESDDSDPSRLVWLTLVSILRATSFVGTANWQYLLPGRRKTNTKGPFEAFQTMVRTIQTDMQHEAGLNGPRAKFEVDDARTCASVPDSTISLVITSPPYANNYDYADATRLEMTFLGEIAGWGDLQSQVRQHLVRSCTQHVPERSVSLSAVLSSPELEPIKRDINNVCEQLSFERQNKGGKKTYHNMVACYFLDLARVWLALRRVCETPSELCFVIGDSAPYGVYVPTHEWLGKLAIAAGFQSYHFNKVRDRNTKWKNRKHRVPLCEGELWVKG